MKGKSEVSNILVQVSNKNLRKIAEKLGLPSGAIRSTKADVDCWLPPGYSAPGEQTLVKAEAKLVAEHGWSVGEAVQWITLEEVAGLKVGEVDKVVELLLQRKNAKEETKGVQKLREFRVVADKSCADCVEALIGSQLLHGGPRCALTFMSRVGLDLSGETSIKSLFDRNVNLIDVVPFTPQTSALCVQKTPLVGNRLDELLAKIDIAVIEDIVGYTWKEKSFILQAFTHPSYGDNRITETYERLELLGDAVLDYLVTCYIYCKNTDADPGRVTDIRSALVNNNFFAALLTDVSLDKHILHSAPGVYRKVLTYLEDRWWDDDTANVDHNLRLFNEEELFELDMVEVPKVLGDVFEAIIGAVFLDCGHDLPTVWRVYNRLCPQLDSVVANPPLNLKKQLVEKFPGQFKFGPAIMEDHGGAVTVEVLIVQHPIFCHLLSG